MQYADFLAYSDALYQLDKDDDRIQSDRLARHRHLEPDAAKFLASLVMASKAERILEIGTSTGYSTLWLAYAIHQRANTNAHITSIDIDSARLAIAQQRLADINLAKQVKLVQADADDFLQQSQNYDLIFLDAERQYYAQYIKTLTAVLAVGGTLIVDNVISHAHEVTGFLAYFIENSHFITSVLPIGAGLLMAVKQA